MNPSPDQRSLSSSRPRYKNKNPIRMLLAVPTVLYRESTVFYARGYWNDKYRHLSSFMYASGHMCVPKPHILVSQHRRAPTQVPELSLSSFLPPTLQGAAGTRCWNDTYRHLSSIMYASNHMGVPKPHILVLQISGHSIDGRPQVPEHSLSYPCHRRCRALQVRAAGTYDTKAGGSAVHVLADSSQELSHTN